MIHNNPAPADHPLHELLKNRWSPVSFADKPVEEEKVMSLLEAARWAPSSFNEQPWSYIVGRKGDETHAKLSECLTPGNSWAKAAPVLLLSVAKIFFEHKHKPNRHYMHDTGAASACLVLQATEMDLYSHQMEGWSIEKAREFFNIGEEYEPGSMIAIGYPPAEGSAGTGKPGQEVAPELKEREAQPRTRKPTEDLIWKAA